MHAAEQRCLTRRCTRRTRSCRLSRPFRNGRRPLCQRLAPASHRALPSATMSLAFAGERESVIQPEFAALLCSADDPWRLAHGRSSKVTRACPRVPRTPELVPLEAEPPVAYRRCSRSIALSPESPSGSDEARNFTVDFQRCLTRRCTRRTPSWRVSPSVPRRGRPIFSGTRPLRGATRSVTMSLAFAGERRSLSNRRTAPRRSASELQPPCGLMTTKVSHAYPRVLPSPDRDRA